MWDLIVLIPDHCLSIDFWCTPVVLEKTNEKEKKHLCCHDAFTQFETLLLRKQMPESDVLRVHGNTF